MEIFWQFGPHLATMLVLVCCSAFFSCSEAALFYLGPDDRRAMQSGNAAQRMANDLLARPERLLTAILFWNLMVNMVYFAMGSIIGLRLDRAGQRTEAGIAAVAFLLVLIVFSEMLPKLTAVLMPRLVASLVGLPLTAAIRVVDPLLPLLQLVNRLSRRLAIPRFRPEAYLEIGDLERAIELSTTDKSLARQERAFLENIVALSEMRVEEMMRPRPWYHSYRPPVRTADLEGQIAPIEYLLVTEFDSDEVAAAIPLGNLSNIPTENLEQYAQEVLYVPWSATVAAALDAMRRQRRQVGAVVNEHGETVGIVTIDDVLDTVVRQSSRSERLLRKVAIKQVDGDAWQVSGMMTLRRLSKLLDVTLPETKSITVAGLLHECLQHLPREGDVVRWGPIEIQVVDVPEHGMLTARLRRNPAEEPPS